MSKNVCTSGLYTARLHYTVSQLDIYTVI